MKYQKQKFVDSCHASVEEYKKTAKLKTLTNPLALATAMKSALEQDEVKEEEEVKPQKESQPVDPSVKIYKKRNLYEIIDD